MSRDNYSCVLKGPNNRWGCEDEEDVMQRERTCFLGGTDSILMALR